jgi:hypothetical protein
MNVPISKVVYESTLDSRMLHQIHIVSQIAESPEGLFVEAANGMESLGLDHKSSKVTATEK